MPSTTINNTNQTNYQSLKTAINPIRQHLQNYIASLNNQPITETPNLQSTQTIPPRLEQLYTTFNLSDFEKNILLFCIGMEIDSSFEYLCIKACGNPQRPYPTFGLALEIFPDADWDALTPESPLRHWQLIELSQSQTLTKSALKIDENILHYLTGAPYSDSRIKHVIAPLPAEISAIPICPSQSQIVAEITETWLSFGNPTNSAISENQSPIGQAENKLYPLLQLCGKTQDNNEAIATHICTTLNLKPQILSLRHLPTESESLNRLISRWQRQAILTNSALLIPWDTLYDRDPILLNAITDIIENSNTPIILTTNQKIPFDKRHSVIFDIPHLTSLEQKLIWQLAFEEIVDDIDETIDKLANHFNLSAKAIINTSAQLKGARNETLRTEEIHDKLWYICRTTSRPQLDEYAERLQTSITLNDLILPEKEKNILIKMINQVRQRVKVYEKWEIANKNQRGLGISALFHGGFGTGKTMAAQVIANELGLDIYRVELSSISSKYIGETEKNLYRLFKAAEAASVVLLFDEADSIFGKRTEVKDSRDRYANMTTSHLLQLMESYQGITILTTNIKQAIDPAFERRLRFKIEFAFPDREARAKMWEGMLSGKVPTEGLNYKRLAQAVLAGGNIRNVALNAAFIAAGNNEPVMMKHLLDAAKLEYVKIEKLWTDNELKGWV